MPEQQRLVHKIADQPPGLQVVDLKFERQNGEWYYYSVATQPGITIQSQDGPFGDVGTVFTARIKNLCTMTAHSGEYKMVHVANIEPVKAAAFGQIGVLFY